jgi:hypothetical protein
VAPVISASLVAASAARQTAREVRGAAAVEPLQNEPTAKIIIDPPLAEPPSHGRVVIQYRTENPHIVPVFRPAALAVSPRVGHIHVTVDDAAWAWSDASGEPVILNGQPPGPHKVMIQLDCEPSIARSRHRQVHGACREAAAGGAPAMISDSAQDHKDNRC